MLKRIVSIAALTGAGQLLAVFSLKYISGYGSPEQLKSVAQIDSLIQFMMNIIALGLQTAAMRDFAHSGSWKTDFVKTQSARLCLSFLIIGLSPLAYFNHYYLLFFFAPLLALSGDYALYARGLPVAGALVSFLRLFIPFSLIMIISRYRPDWLAAGYIIALVMIYVITNLSISRVLETPFFSKPRFRDLHLYVQTLSLGIVILALYFIGLGLVMIIPYFYTNAVVAVCFVGLKFYMLFKGVIRIIHQAFVKEMAHFAACLKVDQLTSLIGLSFLSFMIGFPDTFIRFFFGEKYLPDKGFFICLAIAAQVYSLFSSLIIKAIFIKRDKIYAAISVGSALVTIALCIIASFLYQTSSAIGFSLIAGEILFAISMLLLMQRPALISERAPFFLTNLPIIILPPGLRYLLGDRPLAFIISIVLFACIMAPAHYRKFRMVSIDQAPD